MAKWWMALALLATPTLAFAQDPGPRVEQAWARATPGGSASTGAAYATLETASPDKLVGASTPIAGRAELHEHVDQGGVMRMRGVDSIPVRPGTPTVLKPGGPHVMLMELKRPLKEGDSFPMSFIFEKAGAREVTVRVERAGAMGPPSGEHRHGPHGGGGASAKPGA